MSISYEEAATNEWVEKATLFGEEGVERYTGTSLDEAIEAAIDGLPAVEGTVIIEVAAPHDIKGAVTPEDILNDLYERLDDDYGDPEGAVPEPSEEVKALAQQLIAAIEQDFKVWTCDVLETVEVDVVSWVMENQPDWLDDGDRCTSHTDPSPGSY